MSPLATFCDVGRSLTLEGRTSLVKVASSNVPYASFFEVDTLMLESIVS